MKAVLLCGGVGKRMFPITDDKLLLKFLGKPLLEHQIDRAREAGLKELVIVANPQNVERIEQIAKGVSGLRAEIVVQENPLGIANALESAERFLEGEVMVLNPNDVFESSACTSLIQESRKSAAVSYLTGYEVKDYFPGGYLVVDEGNQLRQIVEKPRSGEEPSNLVNILVHLHNDARKLLDYIKKVHTTRDDIYECALDRMVREGNRIQVVPYRGFWAAIKYPWHIFTVVRYFLNNSGPSISPSAQISSRATVEGNVIIGDNVRVLENAVVRGPAYVGPGSIIGNNALVRDYSHIGANCVVGYCTEVKGSYIGDGCWFHSNYVGDSIIADDCSFGAGTVLANFRFDEKDIKVRMGDEIIDTGLDKFGTIMGSGSKTGINASILPGIRVGPRSFVGPHVCLTKDLGPNKIALAEPRYRVIGKEIDIDVNKKEELMKKLEKL
jgi:UDP-N-acetylglucosamine diphosphorylase / glucose-1-phosphate thymidylyltransferase / UDP-N-acetylgalactosamine diphosphorylase / glucosamine-1-phosphate N-acetyltransferase / galactosamine-1-phosphate N-acetyltransferase